MTQISVTLKTEKFCQNFVNKSSTEYYITKFVINIVFDNIFSLISFSILCDCYILVCVQCLRLGLNDVMNTGATHHLYPFMQFLKSEAAVNVLQFCLSCGELSKFHLGGQKLVAV
jgi:hypothetical protein